MAHPYEALMKYLLGLISLVFSLVAHSQTTIYAIDIPGLHEKSGGGVYDKMINDSLVASGKAKIEVFPPARVEKSFENCQNCCFSPANLNPEFYNFGADVVVTAPMGVAKIYIFAKPGEAAYASLDAIKGKTVGIRKGMPYGKSFDGAGLKTQAASEITNNITKLDKGRIDVMVAYTPDAYDAFDSMGKEPYPHDKDNPVAVHNDSMVCRGVDASVLKAFDEYVNANAQ